MPVDSADFITELKDALSKIIGLRFSDVSDEDAEKSGIGSRVRIGSGSCFSDQLRRKPDFNPDSKDPVDTDNRPISPSYPVEKIRRNAGETDSSAVEGSTSQSDHGGQGTTCEDDGGMCKVESGISKSADTNLQETSEKENTQIGKDSPLNENPHITDIVRLGDTVEAAKNKSASLPKEYLFGELNCVLQKRKEQASKAATCVLELETKPKAGKSIVYLGKKVAKENSNSDDGRTSTSERNDSFVLETALHRRPYESVSIATVVKLKRTCAVASPEVLSSPEVQWSPDNFEKRSTGSDAIAAKSSLSLSPWSDHVTMRGIGSPLSPLSPLSPYCSSSHIASYAKRTIGLRASYVPGLASPTEQPTCSPTRDVSNADRQRDICQQISGAEFAAPNRQASSAVSQSTNQTGSTSSEAHDLSGMQTSPSSSSSCTCPRSPNDMDRDSLSDISSHVMASGLNIRSPFNRKSTIRKKRLAPSTVDIANNNSKTVDLLSPPTVGGLSNPGCFGCNSSSEFSYRNLERDTGAVCMKSRSMELPGIECDVPKRCASLNDSSDSACLEVVRAGTGRGAETLVRNNCGRSIRQACTSGYNYDDNYEQISTVRPRDVTSHEVGSRDVTSHEVISRDVTSHEVRSRDLATLEARSRDLATLEVRSRDVTSHEVRLRDVTSHEVRSRDAGSHEVRSRDVTSHEVRSRDAGSHEVRSRDVTSHEVRSRDAGSHEVRSRDVTSHEVRSLDVTSHEDSTALDRLDLVSKPEKPARLFQFEAVCEVHQDPEFSDEKLHAGTTEPDISARVPRLVISGPDDVSRRHDTDRIQLKHYQDFVDNDVDTETYISRYFSIPEMNSDKPEGESDVHNADVSAVACDENVDRSKEGDGGLFKESDFVLCRSALVSMPDHRGGMLLKTGATEKSLSDSGCNCRGRRTMRQWPRSNSFVRKSNSWSIGGDACLPHEGGHSKDDHRTISDESANTSSVSIEIRSHRTSPSSDFRNFRRDNHEGYLSIGSNAENGTRSTNIRGAVVVDTVEKDLETTIPREGELKTPLSYRDSACPVSDLSLCSPEMSDQSSDKGHPEGGNDDISKPSCDNSFHADIFKSICAQIEEKCAKLKETEGFQTNRVRWKSAVLENNRCFENTDDPTQEMMTQTQESHPGLTGSDSSGPKQTGRTVMHSQSVPEPCRKYVTSSNPNAFPNGFATFPLARSQKSCSSPIMTADDRDVITNLLITNSGEPLPPSVECDRNGNHDERMRIDGHADGLMMGHYNGRRHELPLSVSVTVPEPTSFHQPGNRVCQHLIGTGQLLMPVFRSSSRLSKSLGLQKNYFGSGGGDRRVGGNERRGGASPAGHGKTRWSPFSTSDKSASNAVKDKNRRNGSFYQSWSKNPVVQQEDDRLFEFSLEENEEDDEVSDANMAELSEGEQTRLSLIGKKSRKSDAKRQQQTPELQSLVSKERFENCFDGETENVYEDLKCDEECYAQSLIEYVRRQDLAEISEDIKSLYRYQIDVALNRSHQSIFDQLVCCFVCSASQQDVSFSNGSLHSCVRTGTEKSSSQTIVAVSGEGLSVGVVGQMSRFRVDTRGLNGNLKVQVNGPRLPVQCYADCVETESYYQIVFTPQEVGVFTVSVTWNDRPVPGSPFRSKVIDPRKVLPISGWNRNIFSNGGNCTILTTNVTKSIGFNTKHAGPGELTATVSDPNGDPVPVEVRSTGKFKIHISFLPKLEGSYEIQIFWSGVPLPLNPLIGTTHHPTKHKHNHDDIRLARYQHLQEQDGAPVSTSAAAAGAAAAANVFLEVRQRDFLNQDVQAGDVMECVIDGAAAEPGSPSVSLIGLNDREDIPCNRIDNNKYSCSFSTSTPGAYLLCVTWSGHHIRGSPYKITVQPRTDVSRVTCSGEGLGRGVVGQQMKVQIYAENAGPGEPVCVCTGPSDGEPVECTLVDHENGIFTLVFHPRKPGLHKLQIKFGGIQVPGSPFMVEILEGSGAQDVLVSGPGIRNGPLDSFDSSFMVETRKAGYGQLTVKIRGPKGAFKVEMERLINQDRTIVCRYDPTEAGQYVVSVKWSNVDVPGSPFVVHIYPRLTSTVKE